MELLEAVNNILPYFGEATVVRVDNKHPTVALIRDTIDGIRKNLLAEGWWFNVRDIELFPSVENTIIAPANCISIEGLDGRHVEMRGSRIFDLNTGSFTFREKIRVHIHEDIPFNELPRTVAYWITCRAAAQAYTKDYGVEDVLQVMQMREQEAYNKMLAEHLRKRGYNTWNTPAGRKYLEAIKG